MTNGWAQSKGTNKRTSTAVLSMRAQNEGTISVSFTSAPDGAALAGGVSGQRTLDLGTVSHQGGAHNPNVQLQKFPGHFVAATKFGLKIEDGTQHGTTATVLAALAVPENTFSFRLDGVPLSTAPQMVQGHAKLGATIAHKLEIDVPSTVTERNSQVHNAIIFQIIPN